MSLKKRSAYAILSALGGLVVAVDLGRVSRNAAIGRFETFVDKFGDRPVGDVQFIWVSEKSGACWHMWQHTGGASPKWTQIGTPQVDFVAQMMMVEPETAKATLAA